jgi:hypothetical protein
MTDDDVVTFEVTNPLYKLTGPYAPSFALEILDSRLSSTALRVLLYLRIRCGNKPSCFVSNEVIARHLHMSTKTVSRNLEELIDLKLLSLKDAPVGRSKIKSTSLPVDVYGEVMLSRLYECLKSDAPDESVNYITNFTPELAPDLHGTKMSSGQKCPMGNGEMDKNVPWEMDKNVQLSKNKPRTTSGSDQVKSEDPESLAATFSLIADSRMDLAVIQKEEVDRGEEKKESSAKERKFDAVIQKVMADTLSSSERDDKAQKLLESTRTKIKEHGATKAAKQAHKLKEKIPEASDRSWGGFASSQEEKPKTAKDVEAWLKIGIQDYVDPSATLTKWGIEDKNIAKLYLNALDGDWKLAAGVIDYVCKNWSKIGWKDAPYPKMHMIYRDRDELIAKYNNDKAGITTSPEAEKVRGWLQDAVDRHIKLVKLPSWAYQDRESKAAAKLLSDMGEDEAQRLIEFTCREWKSLKEKLKLPDQEYPTISILNSAYGDTIKTQAKKHGITSVSSAGVKTKDDSGIDF